MSWKKTIQPDPSAKAGSWRDTIQAETQEEGLLNTAATKLAAGGAFGFDDEFAGALSAIGRAAGVENLGGKIKDISLPSAGWDPTLDFDTLKDAYNKTRNQTLALKEKMSAEHPVLSAVAETAGSLAVPTFGASTLAGRAGVAAAQGGLSGLGNSNEDTLSGLATDAAIGAGLGAGFQVAGEKVVAPLLKKGGELAQKGFAKLTDKLDDSTVTALKKIGRISNNIPEEYTDEYLARQGQIDARPGEQIMDELVGRHNDAEAALKNAQEAFVNSKSTYSDVEQGLQNQFRDQKFALRNKAEDARTILDDAFQSQKEALQTSRQEYQNQLQDYKYHLRNKLYDAKNVANEAFQTQKESLKSKNLLGLRGDITDSINYLKDQVSKGSADAYKILESEPGYLSLGTAKQAVDKGIDSLMINGSPVSDSAVSSVASLNKFKERLKALGDEITFPQAKQIMQQLDKDIDYGMKAGEFSPEADAVKRQVRSILDKIVKEQVPTYREQMLQVAKNANLLNRASESFGDEARAISRLNSLGSDRGQLQDVALLKELGSISKDNFSAPIDEYLKTQDILRTPSKLREFREALPEYQQFLNTQKEFGELLNPAMARDTTQDLLPSKLKALKESLPEFKRYAEMQAELERLMDPAYARNIYEAPELMQASKALEGSQAALDSAKSNYDIFRSVNPNQVQSKMKAVTGARSYGADNIFEKINEATGKDYTKEIRDRAILDSFTNGDTNGSRKTLLGAITGRAIEAGVGGAIGYGATDSPYGAAVGAVAGFGADKYAGQVFKAMLDGKIGADKALQVIGPQMGKYGKVLMDAASRGNASLAATHFLLSNQDANYRDVMSKINGGQ